MTLDEDGPIPPADVATDGAETLTTDISTPPPTPAPLAWHQRAQNRVRMALSNWLGLTYVLQQLNLRIGGNRADIEALSAAANHQAKLIEMIVTRLNENTKLLNAFEEGYPILKKIAVEYRAREIHKAQKAKSNGQESTSKIILP